MNQEEEQPSIFLSKILTFLRLGWTKDEVRKKLGVGFEEVYKSTLWLTEIGGVLNYIMRAWSCFYKSYDFVSAILNAVNMIGDTRINCALTGMVACMDAVNIWNPAAVLQYQKLSRKPIPRNLE